VRRAAVFFKGIGSPSARLLALSLQSWLARNPKSISAMNAAWGLEKWGENIPEN